MCEQGTCRIHNCVQAAKCPEPVSTAGGPPPRTRAELRSSDKRRLRSSVLKRSRLQVHWKSACHKSPPCVDRDTHKALHSREPLSLPIGHLCPEVSHLPGGRASVPLTPAAWMADVAPWRGRPVRGPAWGKCVKVSFCLLPALSKGVEIDRRQ